MIGDVTGASKPRPAMLQNVVRSGRWTVVLFTRALRWKRQDLDKPTLSPKTLTRFRNNSTNFGPPGGDAYDSLDPEEPFFPATSTLPHIYHISRMQPQRHHHENPGLDKPPACKNQTGGLG